MTKWLAAAAAAGLLAVVLPVPAAHAAEPAPTDVEISWKDSTHQYVHVTWREDSDRPNRIVVRARGESTDRFVRHVPAGAANEIDLPKSAVRQAGTAYEVLQIGVSAEDADGAAAGAVGLSAAFDILYAGEPLIEGFSPSGSAAVRLDWRNRPRQDRDTPGDPLDVDPPVLFQPMYRVGTATPVDVGRPTTAAGSTFAVPKPPFEVAVRAQNEWDAGPPSEWVRGRLVAFTTSIPRWVLADAPTVVSGTFSGPPTVRVTLQARNTAASAWYVVSSADFSGGRYRFSLASRGTREYRVAVANTVTSTPSTVWYGGYSAPVTTTTQMTVWPTVYREPAPVGSGLARIGLSIMPGIDGRGELQRWNGKTWTLVGYVFTKHGYGDAYLSSKVASRFAYRFYVPTHRFGAVTVAASYSATFYQTITR
jgi:hypothetical protein